MIPKVIHYCWFGRGEKSKLMKKCIKSWHKYCPDYEIIEWNEDNFDINSNTFLKQAYECKKWAFVSDYVRLYVLYNYGGIYMDTDVELLKSFDVFLNDNAFIGFERADRLGSGIIGVNKGNEIIKEWLEHYSELAYINDGKITKEPNVIFMTELFKEKGLTLNNKQQQVAGFKIYPRTYFCPVAVDERYRDFTKDTYAVHHFTSSWRTKEEMKKFKKAVRHQTWWYRTYEKIIILPQKTLRFIIGDETVENLKKKLGR